LGLPGGHAERGSYGHPDHRIIGAERGAGLGCSTSYLDHGIMEEKMPTTWWKIGH